MINKEKILENHFGSEYWWLEEEGYLEHILNAMGEYAEVYHQEEVIRESEEFSYLSDGEAHRLANIWVFETDGNNWSNNNDTAGDNYRSFIAGYNEGKSDKVYGMYKEDQVLEAIKLSKTYILDPESGWMEPISPIDIINQIKQK